MREGFLFPHFRNFAQTMEGSSASSVRVSTETDALALAVICERDFFPEEESLFQSRLGPHRLRP